LEYARETGCFTACITCVPGSLITKTVDVAIVPIVGAEAIAGSSRMKAGTAQKMVLNMISTGAMIRLGYVNGNRMTNVKSSNAKLKERSLRILIAETSLDEEKARKLMSEAEDDLRAAIVMFRAGVSNETAMRALEENDYVVVKAIETLKV
jgi:N-acetylmuramic acid 6-phosphate etherase